MSAPPQPDFAIIGGGIVGLILALGLQRRKIKVTVYEQAQCLREIGAGVAFTANAIKCMDLIEPNVVAALRSVATSNGDPDNPNDYLQWVDGYSQSTREDPRHAEVLFKLYAGKRGFEGCHRAHFVDALAKFMPEGLVRFGKRLDTVSEPREDGKVDIRFCDGTTARAHAVLGCDGIKSRVRQILLGPSSQASYAHYSHKVAYRGLIPMTAAVSALGEYKAKNQHMHVGPKAHVLHFPVANQTLMNVVAFVSDPHEWPDKESMVAQGHRSDVQEAFRDWAPTVRDVVSLLPEALEKWAVFDSYDNPAPYYSKGRLCVLGDAAHASAPHHGAGAGIGVEDALCLSELLALACETLQDPQRGVAVATDAPVVESLDSVINAVFNTFNALRKERSQWLVASSRHVCDIYEWADPATAGDPQKCLEEIQTRSHKIWYFDYDGMLELARQGYRTLLELPTAIASAFAEKDAEEKNDSLDSAAAAAVSLGEGTVIQEKDTVVSDLQEVLVNSDNLVTSLA